MAWVTGFKDKPFLQARLKLTAYYTLGILVILFIFNLAVYSLFANYAPDRLDNELAGEIDLLELQIYAQAEERLRTVLYTVDGVAVILVAVLSYGLAGRALRPIEASYKRQRKFVADAAHELRTPLAVMKTGAETVLGSDGGIQDYRKLTNDSLEELDHLSSMVDDLLFLARGDDLRKVEFTRLDLGKLAHRQVELMKPHADKKGTALKEASRGEFYVTGNEAYLKRLLANLIQNAIDYNKPGGEVVVSLQKNKQQVELKIADTGVGISQEDLKHVFDRFYKADQARAGESSGAGLGLSIVEEIVKLHKARIKIGSKLNEGTVVEVAFPIAGNLSAFQTSGLYL